MRNINEFIKDLESKFTKFDSDPLKSSVISFLNDNNDNDEDNNDHDDSNESDNDDHHNDRDLVDLELHPEIHQSEEQKTSNPSSRAASNPKSTYRGASSYRYNLSYPSPEKDETNLNSYLTN